MSLLILLCVPALISLLAYFIIPAEKTQRSSYSYYFRAPNQITISEFALQIGIQSLLICLIYSITLFSSLGDREVLSGRVTKKLKERVSCEHSYPCNPHDCFCSTDKNGFRSCSTCWDTCYDHDYDIAWSVYDSIGNDWWINRIDRQGLQEPPRWTAVQIGEETSTTHHYTNYIKYSQNSLFNRGVATTKFTYPNYPDNIYDYYRLDRLVDTGAVIKDKAAWNKDIAAISSDLGANKQINFIMVITKDKPQEYFNSLASAWYGAKKNDVVLVTNVDSTGTITWANVLALSKDSYFQVKLRDDVESIKTLDRSKIMSAVRDDVVKYYIRRPMSDFKYLLYATKVSTTAFVVSLIFSILISIGITAFMYNNDVV